ncbi:hypothetical protein V8E54_009844 [Elaphomyces granulatus]
MSGATSAQGGHPDSQETPTRSRHNRLRRKRSDEFKRLTMLAELRSSTITSHSNLKEQHFTSLKDCCARTTMTTTVMSCEPPETIEVISNLGSGKDFPRTTDESTD